jgi:hypothetical protein
MTFSVWFEGINDLNVVAAEIRNGTVKGLLSADKVWRASTFAVQRWAQSFVPVDTGNLRSSITVEFRGGLLSGVMESEIGPEASYGSYVEYGTSRFAPRAYMGPAMDRVSGVYMAAIEALADPLRPGVVSGGI